MALSRAVFWFEPEDWAGEGAVKVSCRVLSDHCLPAMVRHEV